MVRVYKPKQKLYTDASIAKAVSEVNAGGKCYKVAKKYHCSTSMLRKRVLETNGQLIRKKQVC